MTKLSENAEIVVKDHDYDYHVFILEFSSHVLPHIHVWLDPYKYVNIYLTSLLH